MSKQGVGNTAVGAAACRFIEQYQPEETRLFHDPIVKDLLSPTVRLMMQLAPMRNLAMKKMDSMTEGIYGLQISRTCFIDDVVQTALSEGIDQLVILGAGLDTRPYRLPGMDRVKVFEVDLPFVQEDKKKKLAKLLGRLPEHVTYIPIDFDTQSLETSFAQTTFDPSRRAVFVWEAVTQYISEEAVHQTLTFVGRSAPGSRLVFTYVLKSIIERRSEIPGADKLMDFVAKEAPWVFGLEPSSLQDYLKPFHLHLLADVGNADYQEKYLKPRNRELIVSEGERIAYAAVNSPE